MLLKFWQKHSSLNEFSHYKGNVCLSHVQDDNNWSEQNLQTFTKVMTLMHYEAVCHQDGIPDIFNCYRICVTEIICIVHLTFLKL